MSMSNPDYVADMQIEAFGKHCQCQVQTQTKSVTCWHRLPFKESENSHSSCSWLYWVETVQLVTMKYFYVIIEIWCWALFHVGHVGSMLGFIRCIILLSPSWVAVALYQARRPSDSSLGPSACFLFTDFAEALGCLFEVLLTLSLEVLKITLYPVLLSFNGLKQTLQHLRWCDAILVSLWELKAQETYNFPL